MNEMMPMGAHRVRPAVVVMHIETDRGSAPDAEQRLGGHADDTIECPYLLCCTSSRISISLPS